jgi:hypothetical protein
MLRLRLVAAGAALLALLAAAPARPPGQPELPLGHPRHHARAAGREAPGPQLRRPAQLDNRTGKTIVVQGYQREPYARLLADGTVEVNHNSPAFYLNDDRFAPEKVPATAKPSATPNWQVVDRTGTFQWHDHRIHWMSSVPPKQVTDSAVKARASGLADGKKRLRATFARKLAAGKYAVSWRVKADDGDTEKGTFRFTVR